MKTIKIIIGYIIGILAFCIYFQFDILRIGLWFLLGNTGISENALAIICPYILAAITTYLICIYSAGFNNKEKLLLKISFLIGLFISVFILYFPPYKDLCHNHFSYPLLSVILEYSISAGLSLIIYAVLNYMFKFNLEVSKEVNLKTDVRRGVAMLIDTITIVGILVVFMVLITFITMNNSIFNAFSLILINSGLWFKDCFKGSSLGKRLNGIEIVDKNTLKPVSLTKRFIRNLFLTFWFIEMFVWLFNPNSRRIGDYVAGTIVINNGKY